MPVIWAPLPGGLVVGLIAAVTATRWLRRRSYRYEDEADAPVRDPRWLWGVLPVAMGLVAVGWWPSSPSLAVLWGVMTIGLGVLSAIDLDVHRLPDRLTFPLAGVVVAGVVVVGLIDGTPHAIVQALAGGAALGAFYLLQVIIGGARGMGLGDAKLAVSLGMILGFSSWWHVFVATLAAYLIALVWGIGLILFRGAGRRTEIAFGPHMALGAVLVAAVPGVVALVGLL